MGEFVSLGGCESTVHLPMLKKLKNQTEVLNRSPVTSIGT